MVRIGILIGTQKTKSVGKVAYYQRQAPVIIDFAD
jgi:hypothetical protein